MGEVLKGSGVALRHVASTDSYVFSMLAAARRTIALQCPHPVALELLDMTGPIAVTSANTSTDEPAQTAAEVRSVFGQEILTYLEDDAGGGSPSTLVDLTNPAERVLRKGPVTF